MTHTLRRLALMATAAGLALASPAVAQTPRAPQDPTLIQPRIQEDEALKAAIASDSRAEADRARDRYRHPYESLTFWGLQPGQTVVEIEPGRAGWWSEILSPYAEATSGRYVAVNRPLDSMGVEPGEADFVLVARAFHNWHQAGRTEAYMAAFFDALAPGGILAVEQHRAPAGANVDQSAPTGYVPETYVIAAARKAGFVLEASSDLNANLADDHSHPFGVWTLPPVRRSEGDGRVLTPAERAAYDAVGESDRMTLRFRKPE
jgi:predicted methyltransferase